MNARSYLLSVVCAAIICGIVNGLMQHGKSTATITKFLTGIFMALTVVRPLVGIDLSALTYYTQGISQEAHAAAAFGENSAEDAQTEIIKANVEAYILDKAEDLHISVSVSVQLSQEAPFAPCGITVRGNVSPYAKTQLSQFLNDELGIPKEAQIWHG